MLTLGACAWVDKLRAGDGAETRARVGIVAPNARAGSIEPTAGPGWAQLVTGLKRYDNGEFDSATQALRDALRVGLGPGGQVLAHKHLAFVYCVTNKDKQCRSEFRSALSIDPNFELDQAEAGHPLWGPVYREVKAQRK